MPPFLERITIIDVSCSMYLLVILFKLDIFHMFMYCFQASCDVLRDMGPSACRLWKGVFLDLICPGEAGCIPPQQGKAAIPSNAIDQGKTNHTHQSN